MAKGIFFLLKIHVQKDKPSLLNHAPHHDILQDGKVATKWWDVCKA
jgi:hypothetical protein